MNKPKLTLPNGLQLSVGDKTNIGIIDNFDYNCVYIEDMHFYFPEITSVQHRYDWTNALGEPDFAWKGDEVFYVAYPEDDRKIIEINIGFPDDQSRISSEIFSKQSDAERYLKSLQPKEEKIKKTCYNCKKFEDIVSYYGCSKCDEHYSSWQPKEEKKEDVLLAYDFFKKMCGTVNYFDAMIAFAKEACKKQREICADSINDGWVDDGDWLEYAINNNGTKKIVLTAPEPKMQ